VTDYVEGDINQVGDDDYEDDYDANASHDEHDEHVEAPLSIAVLTHIATSLADEPDEVSVVPDARGRRVTLRLNVAQQDMGRVIGRRGRTAQAIRALVAAAGAKEGVTTSVDIVD
jgi:uncharacterized protein